MIYDGAIPRLKSAGTAEMAFQMATVLFAFCMPLLSRGLMVPLSIWLLAWVFVPKSGWRDRWIPIAVFAGLYLFHIIGMLYTDNLSRGWSDLEQKLSILVFPLLLGLVRPDVLNFRRGVLGAFTWGTALALVISFATAVFDYQESGLVEEFYSSRFSHVHHPSYLAMYMNLSLAGIFLYLYKGAGLSPKKWGIALLALFISVSLVFPASKMGFIQFGFLMVFGLWVAHAMGKWKSKATAVLLACGALFAGTLWLNPSASERIAIAIEVASQPKTAIQTGETETNVARLITWKLTLQEIGKNPLGVGTGDIQDVLTERYRAEGLEGLAESGLNPHNNYLQIGLALGIPALLWFLFSLAYPFAGIWRQRDWIYGFFLVGMAMHMAVESMLEKQSGVVFFAFFNAFFFFSQSRLLTESKGQ